MRIESTLVQRGLPAVFIGLLLFIVSVPCHAQDGTDTITAPEEKSTESSVAKSEPAQTLDKPGSVQAGVQTLVNKLVEGMQLSEKKLVKGATQ